ncbi:MAG: MBOAT family protein [Planctomycetota bacterium]
MGFLSPEFVLLLALGLPLVFLSLGPWQRDILLGLSLVAYGWHEPLSVLLLVVSGLWAFLWAGSFGPHRSRCALALSVSGSLAVLVTVKYAAYFGGLLHRLTGWDAWLDSPSWILPVGVSFYTFQIVSYSVDVWKGALPPCRGFREFLLYISFFPQLVAGPIVRGSVLLPQLRKRIIFGSLALESGIALFLWGAVKKTAANSLGLVVNDAHAHSGVYQGWQAWVVVWAYALQIFLDFSGYSTMALGLGRMMGINLPVNFQWPYLARGFRDFWRRWHITLSLWIRDYIYIPLGGSRGSRLKVALTLVVTMMLGGLWHGAANAFVLWGLLHGILLATERWGPFSSLLSMPVLGRLATFQIAALLFVPFRAGSVSGAQEIIKAAMMPVQGAGVATPEFVMVLVLLGAALIGHGAAALFGEGIWDRLVASPRWRYPLCTLGLVYILAFFSESPHIYFRF